LSFTQCKQKRKRFRQHNPDANGSDSLACRVVVLAVWRNIAISLIEGFGASKKDRSGLATATSNYIVGAIMKLSISLLAVFVSLPAVTADSATASKAANAALLEQGKKIFITRCAKCHDNDANKKLPDGTTLLGRLAKIQDPEARLGTRLKDPEERHAVMIYVESLLKSLQSSRQ
jgi:mono/diheme cytochrome c family protein